MDKKIKRVKLYVKENNTAHRVEKLVKNALLKHKLELNDNYDILLSIGGDGTFLKMLHSNNYRNTYYGAINAGSLGFLSSVDSNKLDKYISDIANDKYIVKEINLLKVKIYSNELVNEMYCVNEFTIRKSNFSTFKADVYIDKKLLEKYTGDGLVISTPFGSTAYNEALGGSILDNDLKALSITPIAPINNKVYKSLASPIIFAPNKKIVIVPHNNINLCYLTDGEITNDNSITKIECSLDKTIKYVLPSNYDYIDRLKNKIIDTKE